MRRWDAMVGVRGGDPEGPGNLKGEERLDVHLPPAGRRRDSVARRGDEEEKGCGKWG
jgi:hypothetical protein